MYVAWARELAGIGFFARSWLYLGGFAAALAVDTATERFVHWMVGLPTLGAPVAPLAGLAAYAALLGALHPAPGEMLRYCLDLVSPARVAGFLRREIGRS